MKTVAADGRAACGSDGTGPPLRVVEVEKAESSVASGRDLSLFLLGTLVE